MKTENRGRAYEGFEILTSKSLMTIKMLFYAAGVVFTVHGFAVFVWNIHQNILNLRYLGSYVLNGALSFSLDFGKAMHFLTPLFSRNLELMQKSLWVWLLFPMLILGFRRFAQKQFMPEFIRGARLLSEHEAVRFFEARGDECDIPLGRVAKMPKSAEPKHGFYIGRTGAGKTVLKSAMLSRLRERGDRHVIIYDPKGDYTARFYNPETDFIFNPLLTRCLQWNIFDELTVDTDFKTVATGIVPDPVGKSEPFFDFAARDIMEGCLRVCFHENRRTNADLARFCGFDPEIQKKAFENTPGCEMAAKHLVAPKERTAASILSTLAVYTTSIRYLGAIGSDFSAKNWVDKGGWIFIPSNPRYNETLKPLLSLFIDVLGRHIISLNDDYNRRVFVFLDEFGTLQKIPMVPTLMTFGRSKGVSVHIGIQDFGQIDRIYGRETRNTIYNSAGTSAVFAISDPDTAEYLSKKIGDMENVEKEHSLSMGIEDNKDGESITARKKQKPAVLPSEILSLNDLEFFLKLPNAFPCRTGVEYRNYPECHDWLHIRPELMLLKE